MKGNIYKTAVPKSGESFKQLFENRYISIEEIVSSDCSEDILYDQPHDEAIFLLQGSATLWIEGEEVDMSAGDYLCIKARKRHRVLRCEKGTRWLAIHSKEPIC
ncbi:MAG: cupin domain-containing protein [Hydrogenimonas sp.]|nr:cupin domain-containing protein [Hydrogenimonas sp.]